MKKKAIVISIYVLCFVFTQTSSEDVFSGTWCIGDERLIIDFKGIDSLHFYSIKDESINGYGNYEKTDSTITATVKNDDLNLSMGYRYKRKKRGSLRAKIIFFTIDGDSVDHPNRWMRMERCNPDTLSVPQEDNEEM